MKLWNSYIQVCHVSVKIELVFKINKFYTVFMAHPLGYTIQLDII